LSAAASGSVCSAVGRLSPTIFDRMVMSYYLTHYFESETQT
jgi:hypothetical protein